MKTFENLNGDTLNFVSTFELTAQGSDTVQVTWKVSTVYTVYCICIRTFLAMVYCGSSNHNLVLY